MLTPSNQRHFASEFRLDFVEKPFHLHFLTFCSEVRLAQWLYFVNKRREGRRYVVLLVLLVELLVFLDVFQDVDCRVNWIFISVQTCMMLLVRPEHTVIRHTSKSVLVGNLNSTI